MHDESEDAKSRSGSLQKSSCIEARDTLMCCVHGVIH